MLHKTFYLLVNIAVKNKLAFARQIKLILNLKRPII